MKKYCNLCKQRLDQNLFGGLTSAVEFEDGLYCRPCAKKKINKNN